MLPVAYLLYASLAGRDGVSQYEKILLDSKEFYTWFWNSACYTALILLIHIPVSILAAYGLSQFRFPGRNVLFFLYMLLMLLPFQATSVPQYLTLDALDILDTGKAVILPCAYGAFGTFLLRQSYMGLPKDLEEAARLDGCNIGQTFLFIMAPLTRSSMVALGIFTAVFAYKDLMWPLICNKDVMPLSAALAKMQGQYTNNYPQLMAASLLACIPMIVLYLIFQKQFIEGIATSGGKL